jgi:hypothetical protein
MAASRDGDVHVIHRYWTGPGEPEVQPLDGQRIWHDDDLPAEIDAWITPQQVAATDQARHRSNGVRWWLLAVHGGMWLDHDVTVHDTPPAGEWVGAVGSDACAAAIRLPAGHPLAWAMLDHIALQPPSDRRAPAVSGRVPLSLLARRHQVRFEQIPRPGAPVTWVAHDWATSLAGAR